MPRSAAAIAAPDPAPEKLRNVSFSVLVGALRVAQLCPDCKKTRAVLNVAGHGRPFRAERVSPVTHCGCKGGPAYVAPPTAEVCEYCGDERSRAEYYDEPCRGAAQDDGSPGPITGEHSFVRVELDAPAIGVAR